MTTNDQEYAAIAAAASKKRPAAQKISIVLALLLLAAGGIFIGLNRHTLFRAKPRPFVLYGNVDDRQLNLSFLLTERIESIAPEEGDTVKKGELVATLETVRIQNSLSAARAALAAAEANLEKLKNGTRVEDIEIARSALAAAEARLKMTESEYARQKALRESAAGSAQSAERAEADFLLTRAAVAAAKSNLEKQLAGSRKEDVAAAAAEVAQRTAQLAIQQQMLQDARLYAPCDGIVRNRLLEPGEMTTPQSPVLVLAVISPKWVRTYLPETMLTRIKQGDRAAVAFDSLPDAPFDGWVGFISPNAEFTPKNVETPELRSSLVYEVRVMVNDPENLLKLGAPATVSFAGVMAE